jgi:nucleoside-diphosphate-sugar epimerase
MNFVLGSKGRLGSALVAGHDAGQVIALDRSVYANWWNEEAVDEIAHRFDKARGEGVVYVASGIIDPRRPVEEHHQVNFLLAKNVVKGATKAGMRVVTFGTVMEKLIGEKSESPYFLSKLKLGKFISGLSDHNDLALHVRIHTLYGGGRPDGFMFLGQLFDAMVRRTVFRMSSGAQLREYHHIDDEIPAILKLAAAGGSGAIDLSHGKPITLRALAEHIFSEFKCPELLSVGAISGPPSENYETSFQRTPLLTDMEFRDTLPAVVEYLRLCEASSGAGK